MVTVDQVSKRVFDDSSWLIKTVIGAFVLAVPPFALGYLYRVAAQGRRGLPITLPDWDDWRGLFVDGLRFLILIVGLAIGPIILCWVLSILLSWLLHNVPGYWAFAGFLYLPLVPAILLAAPLTGASLYRYQRREEFREAFRFPLLLRMVMATKARLVIPTLAYLGFVIVLFPLIPYALFTGGVVIFYYYAFTFHELEKAAHAAASASSLPRR